MEFSREKHIRLIYLINDSVISCVFGIIKKNIFLHLTVFISKFYISLIINEAYSIRRTLSREVYPGVTLLLDFLLHEVIHLLIFK